jgi:ankyrin repeat protein
MIILSCALLFNILSCDGVEKKDNKITDIRIYKDTPVWKLALAVKNQRWWSIKKIAKETPQLLNYQDPKYGLTLLLWAVGMEKYKSAETLLKCGANPNIASTYKGETPLFVATGYSWIDIFAKKIQNM